MTSSAPMISVIIPVYNVEEYVAECLESVCAQTYRNLEIVIVNDGSTDNSRKICADFAEQDARIRIIDQENGGLSSARNTGLDTATGEYVLFIDSDDVVNSSHIELLYSCMMSQGTDVSITVMTPFESEYPNPKCEYSEPIYIDSSVAVQEMLYQGSFDSCAQSKLFLAALWNGIRFPVGYLHEDLPTTYRVVLQVPAVSFFESNTYGYRQNPRGINWSITTSEKIKTLDLVDDMVERLAELGDDFNLAARCLRTSFCFHLYLHATKSSISNSERQRLIRTIQLDRTRVLLDKHARLKTKYACLLSFFGIGLVKKAFSLQRGNRGAN